MNTIQKHVRIWTRYDAAENVVIVVVQRDLHLLVVGLSVDVHVEGLDRASHLLSSKFINVAWFSQFEI